MRGGRRPLAARRHSPGRHAEKLEVVAHGQALVGLEDQPPDLQRAERRSRTEGRSERHRAERTQPARPVPQPPTRRRTGRRPGRGGGREQARGRPAVARGRGGRADARPARGAMAPVQRRPRRLRSISSGGSGKRSTISRALSVPSMRESTNPSVGVRATGCTRSRGSTASTSFRSTSPRASRTVAGSFSLRAASSRIWPVEIRETGSPSGRSRGVALELLERRGPAGPLEGGEEDLPDVPTDGFLETRLVDQGEPGEDGAERSPLGEHLLDRPLEVRLARRARGGRGRRRGAPRRRRSGRGRCAPRGSTARASPGRG